MENELTLIREINLYFYLGHACNNLSCKNVF